MATWTYVFTDLLTGVEKASLPMVDVSFDQVLNGVGKFSGMVPTTDPKIRALDPWGATEKRRTALYVHRDDQVVWGGIVWGRDRDQDTPGLRITAATFESWLAVAYLRSDVSTVDMQLGAPGNLGGMLLGSVQSYPNADLGIDYTGVGYPWDIGQGGDGTGELKVGGKVYVAADLKTLTEYFEEWVDVWRVPIEWRIDVGYSPVTGYTRTMVIAEGAIYEGRNPIDLSYPGRLLTWAYPEDGSAQANVMHGAASGLFDYALASEVGSDELQAGYPVIGGETSLSGSDVTAPRLDARVKTALVDALAQGEKLTGLTVSADDPDLSSYLVGDVVNAEVTHVSFREWPAAAVFDGYRITGRKVTVGQGKAADLVALTVDPPADQLPRSVAITATLRDMLRRLRNLEAA